MCHLFLRGSTRHIGRPGACRGLAARAVTVLAVGCTLLPGLAITLPRTFGFPMPGLPGSPDPERVLEDTEFVWCLAFSPDGRVLAVGYNGRAGIPGSLKLWEVATGRLLQSQAEPGVVRSVAFSPDGKLLATAHFDRTASLRDATTGAEKIRLRGHASGVNALAFAADGSILATASWDRTIRMWDTSSGAEQAKIETGGEDVYSIAISPDLRWLASGGKDRTVRIWDYSMVELRHTLKGHSNVVEYVAFSPDSKTLATASWDGTVGLWECETGRHLETIRAHNEQVLCVAFSPDGKTLASSSGRWGDGKPAPGPGTVKLWDARTRREIVALDGHGDRIFALAFSPDGKRLASGCSDGKARIWRVDSLSSPSDPGSRQGPP